MPARSNPSAGFLFWSLQLSVSTQARREEELASVSTLIATRTLNEIDTIVAAYETRH